MKIEHLRMIYDPWGWSSVVNISVNISLIFSLIFAILICLIIYVVSTEKLSWEIWHIWMKVNSEVASNIKRQSSEDRDRGFEEVNGPSCSCMRRILDIPVIKKIVKKCMPVVMIVQTIVLGLWPAGNT